MADAVEAARARIDRALNDLEARIRALKAAPKRLPEDDLFAPSPEEYARDATRTAELEAAAREASAALERAAGEVRAMLNGEG